MFIDLRTEDGWSSAEAHALGGDGGAALVLEWRAGVVPVVGDGYVLLGPERDSYRSWLGFAEPAQAEALPLEVPCMVVRRSWEHDDDGEVWCTLVLRVDLAEAHR